MKRLLVAVLMLLSTQQTAHTQAVSLPPVNKTIVRLQAATENEILAPGDKTRIAVKLNVDPAYHIQSNKPTEDWIMPTSLDIKAPPGFQTLSITYPQDILKEFKFAPGKKLAVLESGAVITAEIKAPKSVKPGSVNLTARLTFQPCDQDQCLPPDEASINLPLKIGQKTSAPISSSLFKKTIPAGVSNGEANPFAGIVEKRGWLFLLMAVYAAGLALSLTPCVFPLIPVTLGYFRVQASENRRRTLALALLYVAGIATTYSVLGVIAASSGVLFGAWLSNPIALAVLAVIIGAMAFSMFGAFELRPPALLASRSGGKSGMSGAFAMGLLFGVVAAPCTGPATIALLAFVGALANPVLGLLLFFTLSVGISTPLLLLAIFSGNLPRSGAWMEWVKKLMGSLMLGVAIWLLSPIMGPKLTVWTGGILAVGLGLWLGFLEKSGFSPSSLGAARVITAVVAVGAGIWLIWPKPETAGIVFNPYSSSAIASAAQEKKPVMIDFFADWCVPCKELQSGAFKYPQAIEASKQFVCLAADVTRTQSPEVKQLMQQYSIRGVPTIVFIDSDGHETGQRVQQNVSGKELARIMEQAAKQKNSHGM